jgi:hypothetical protein
MTPTMAPTAVASEPLFSPTPVVTTGDVGDKLGAFDVDSDGEREGGSVGTVVGLGVGAAVGCAVVDCTAVGCAVGEFDGEDKLGALDAESDGLAVGIVLGCAVVGCTGSAVGACVGWQLPTAQLHKWAPGTYSDKSQGHCTNAETSMVTVLGMRTDDRLVHDSNA